MKQAIAVLMAVSLTLAVGCANVMESEYSQAHQPTYSEVEIAVYIGVQSALREFPRNDMALRRLYQYLMSAVAVLDESPMSRYEQLGGFMEAVYRNMDHDYVILFSSAMLFVTNTVDFNAMTQTESEETVTYIMKAYARAALLGMQRGVESALSKAA